MALGHSFGWMVNPYAWFMRPRVAVRLAFDRTPLNLLFWRQVIIAGAIAVSIHSRCGIRGENSPRDLFLRQAWRSNFAPFGFDNLQEIRYDVSTPLRARPDILHVLEQGSTLLSIRDNGGD